MEEEHYTCPVCKEAIERDLAVFLKHTDRHVIDAILKEHPKWSRDHGICQECLDYYKKMLGHLTYLEEFGETEPRQP